MGFLNARDLFAESFHVRAIGIGGRGGEVVAIRGRITAGRAGRRAGVAGLSTVIDGSVVPLGG